MGGGEMSNWQPDWELTPVQTITVALTLSLSKHVTGWTGATDEELEAVAADVLAAAPAAPDQDHAIYANLLSVITDIRHKTGVGAKPMLSELADVLADKIKAAPAAPNGGPR